MTTKIVPQLIILNELCKTREYMTISEMQRLTGIDTDTIDSSLKNLLKLKAIKSINSTPTISYKINTDMQQELTAESSYKWCKYQWSKNDLESPIIVTKKTGTVPCILCKCNSACDIMKDN